MAENTTSIDVSVNNSTTIAELEGSALFSIDFDLANVSTASAIVDVEPISITISGLDLTNGFIDTDLDELTFDITEDSPIYFELQGLTGDGQGFAPASATLSNAGVLSVKNAAGEEKYTTTFSNSYNQGQEDYEPTTVAVTAAGAITVKNSDGVTRLTSTTSNSYNAGNTAGQATATAEYKPESATLSNAGVLSVKNAAGTEKYTETFANSYDAGISISQAETKAEYEPKSATLSNTGVLSVKNAAGTEKYTTSFWNSYNTGETTGLATAKTEYEPTSATLSNAGELSVKNVNGTEKYTQTFANSYAQGVIDGMSGALVGNATVSDVRVSKTFTNSEGVGLVGTMANASITSGTGTLTFTNPIYNSTNDNFDLSASSIIAAPSVETIGYISTIEGTRNTNTISGTTALNKIGIESTNSGDSILVPVIGREAFTITNVIDAASGAAQTTVPTEGVYVKVKSPAHLGTLSSVASVTSSGYGTTTYATIAEAAETAVGADQSADTYVPITTGELSASATISFDSSITVPGKTPSIAKNSSTNISSGNITTTKPSGYYVAVKAGVSSYSSSTTISGTSTATALVSDQGYVTTDDETSVTQSQTIDVAYYQPYRETDIHYIPVTSSTVTPSVVTSGLTQGLIYVNASAAVTDGYVASATYASDLVPITAAQLVGTYSINTTPNIAAQTVDVTNYATNNVASIYEDVSTSAALDSKRAMAYQGQMFRYTGETDTTYTNSALYVCKNVVSDLPLCFTANTAGSTVTFDKPTGYEVEFEVVDWTGYYSLDNLTWTLYEPGTTGAITLTNVGDKVYFKGVYNEQPTPEDEENPKMIYFTMTGSIAASGNIMSLCCGDNYPTITVLPYDYIFYGLFMECDALTSAPELPALTLTDNCYDGMFRACTSLTTLPMLPSTNPTQVSWAYGGMFEGCTSLQIYDSSAAGHSQEFAVPAYIGEVFSMPEGETWAMFTDCPGESTQDPTNNQRIVWYTQNEPV